MSAKIWVVEDDPDLQFIYSNILSDRYQVQMFSTVGEFQTALAGDSEPDLLIADLTLPDRSFLSFLEDTDHLPFPYIIVTSLDDGDVLHACFERGAADYLTKPFRRNEMAGKIRRILRHGTHRPGPGLLDIDPERLIVWRGCDKTPLLTSKEFQIVSVLNAGRIVERLELIERVWGGIKVSPKTLDVHLSNLRKKIAPLGFDIRFIPPSAYQLQALEPLTDRLPAG